MNPWSHGHGLPPGTTESDEQYRRFVMWLEAPKPRTLTHVAKEFKVSVVAIFKLARKCNWEERTRLFDRHCIENAPPLPDPPPIFEIAEVVRDRAPKLPPPVAVLVDASTIKTPFDVDAPEIVLPLQRGSLAAQEEYRVAILSLGKRQLKSAKGLNDAFERLSNHVLDLVIRLGEISAKAKADPDAPAEMVAALQKLENAVENQLATATMSLQRLASASTAMGTQGRENWGQAVGVQVLLERLEAMLAMQEGIGYTEKTPPALPEGANQQEPNDDHE